MPIRMEKDPNESRPQHPQEPGRSGGGFPKGLGLIALLLYLFKKPKWALLVLAIAVAIWFFGGSGGGLLSDNGGSGGEDPFSMGALLSEEKYDQAEVYEPLATSYASSRGNGLPSRASLLQYAPQRLHQGRQGSCVGWASAYAARTILYSKATGTSPNQVPFSPSFLYNQIALQGCQGAYMVEALEAMRQRGTLPFSQFGYDERTCGNQPSPIELQQANRYRIRGYQRLSQGGNNYKTDLSAIKQYLSQGAPVVIGMQVGGSFMHQMEGRRLWQPNRIDYSGRGYSGHAMCVIGYDDNIGEGAFQIMNSWGPEWGDNGTAWVSYRDFDFFVKEAYGLYPEGDGGKNATRLEVAFGLLDNATQRLLRLQSAGNNTFRTTSPIRKGDKFKVAIENSQECYTYVFGQETDGSSYVLFPYTGKHSAYCGITGPRLFPKDYSMTADDLGNRDRIAIVVSKEQIDYNQLNRRINASLQRSYTGKLREALGNYQLQNVKFQAGETISFAAEAKNKGAVGVVIEIDKR